MATALGLQVVAEGVETAEQAAEAHALGAGILLRPPRAAESD